MGQVLPNDELYDALVEAGWFEALPDPSVIIDASYNTPKHVESVLKNYDRFRRSLFTRFGFGAVGTFLNANGMVLDLVFMALVAYGEFSTETGDLYLECVEALSNQYYGEAVYNPGPMQCGGACTFERQLRWATQMEAWYSSGFAGMFISSNAWMSHLSAGQMAINQYSLCEDSSWFWGDVAEADLANYHVVRYRFSNPPTYPGKPYFIVYKLWGP
jgi:hypothetical protein